MTPVRQTRVHRFRQLVAIDINTTHTQYMTADHARALALLLNRAAEDIEQVAFVDSNFPTSYVPETPAP